MGCAKTADGNKLAAGLSIAKNFHNMWMRQRRRLNPMGLELITLERRMKPMGLELITLEGMLPEMVDKSCV